MKEELPRWPPWLTGKVQVEKSDPDISNANQSNSLSTLDIFLVVGLGLVVLVFVLGLVNR